MFRWSVLCIIVIVPVALVLVPSTHIDAQNPVETIIEGFVTDQDGAAVPGVLIRVYVAGNSVAETRSKDPGGEYEMKVKLKQHIATLRYDHSDWHPETVGLLSERKHQKINKILKKDTAMSAIEFYHQLQVYESIYYLTCNQDRWSEVYPVKEKASYDLQKVYQKDYQKEYGERIRSLTSSIRKYLAGEGKEPKPNDFQNQLTNKAKFVTSMVFNEN